jgi:hypothetical protein
MLHIRGVSKKFGEWYQKTNKTEDTNKLTLLAFGHYSGCTAPLTSRRCILNIYSTNIHTEYFKHAAESPIFLSSKCRLFHNATLFDSCKI